MNDQFRDMGPEAYMKQIEYHIQQAVAMISPDTSDVEKLEVVNKARRLLNSILTTWVNDKSIKL